MSLLINESHANPATSLWAPNLPAGLAKSLTWTATGGLYKATITGVAPGLSGSSCLSCTVQDATEADGLGAWLVKAIPSSANGGTITFYTAANPASPSTFIISWSVVKI
jgi:hypothetical protein